MERKIIGLSLYWVFHLINLVVGCFTIPFVVLTNWAAKEARHWLNWSEID